jgi:hypothetical protein
MFFLFQTENLFFELLPDLRLDKSYNSERNTKQSADVLKNFMDGAKEIGGEIGNPNEKEEHV